MADEKKRKVATKSKTKGSSFERDVAKDLGVSLATLYRWVPAK